MLKRRVIRIEIVFRRDADLEMQSPQTLVRNYSVDFVSGPGKPIATFMASWRARVRGQ
jgi:hypothetical protein